MRETQSDLRGYDDELRGRYNYCGTVRNQPHHEAGAREADAREARHADRTAPERARVL
jgi:hypothetical protein